jgi:two-component system response regulator HupR/HoxA
MRMIVQCEGDMLDAGMLSEQVLRRGGGGSRTLDDTGAVLALSPVSGSGPLKDRIERIEAGILLETLVRCRWNKSRAANELGLSRMGLRAKLERYGIERGPATQRH